MNDFISRQALCEYALNQKDKCVTPNDIMRFPSAQPEPQWIPCSERLPDKDGMYIVAFDKNELLEDETQVSDAYFEDGQWLYGILEMFEHRMPRFVVKPITELHIVAWIPLPEPYTCTRYLSRTKECEI